MGELFFELITILLEKGIEIGLQKKKESSDQRNKALGELIINSMETTNELDSADSAIISFTIDLLPNDENSTELKESNALLEIITLLLIISKNKNLKLEIGKSKLMPLVSYLRSVIEEPEKFNVDEKTIKIIPEVLDSLSKHYDEFGMIR